MSRKVNNIEFKRILIKKYAAKGVGVAKAEDGKVIFARNCVPGDLVDLKVTKKRKSHYFANPISFHKYSKERVEPACVHFGVCGGCKWQMLKYDFQIAYKQQEILDNLTKIGKITFPKALPIIPSKKTYLYRNKLEFTFSNNRWLSEDEINSKEMVTEKNALGFHIANMWDKILDIEECHLQDMPSNEIRLALKKFAIENQISFYDLKKREGFLRNLMIRTSTTGDCMVLVQFYQDDESILFKIMNFLKDNFSQITSLQYVINNKANDTIYDREINCFYGKPYIEEKIKDLTFRIRAKSFYQTNSLQVEELYKVIISFATLTGTEIVYDLYTGIGSIAIYLAKYVKKVIGVDIISDAIKDAVENATINEINNLEFYCSDVKTFFKVMSDKKLPAPDVVILDPPREGLHGTVIEQLKTMLVGKIIYVSCNPATQARDLGMLDDLYEVVKLQAVDMFPQTYHIENVVLLKKRR